MPSPSKAKGSTYEREVAKFLSTLYSESFMRAPNSGAYIGGKNSVRKEILHSGQIRSLKGDIIPGPSFPKLNLECKNYKGFPFHQLFSGSVPQLEEWIGQMLDTADKGDFSMLLMKFNHVGKYVVFQDNPSLKLENFFRYNSPRHNQWVIMEYHTFWTLNSGAVKQLSS